MELSKITKNKTLKKSVSVSIIMTILVLMGIITFSIASLSLNILRVGGFWIAFIGLMAILILYEKIQKSNINYSLNGAISFITALLIQFILYGLGITGKIAVISFSVLEVFVVITVLLYIEFAVGKEIKNIIKQLKF